VIIQSQSKNFYNGNNHSVKAHGDIFHSKQSGSNGGNGRGNGNGSHLLLNGKSNGSGVVINLGDSEDSDFERIN